MPDSNTLKIGEAAERLGLSVQTLRFYEQEGLLVTGRTERGTRVYTEDDLQRIQAIRRLVELDIPLQLIRQLADTRRNSESGDQACRAVSDQLGDMTHRLRELGQAIDRALQDIERADHLVRRCRDCQLKPSYRQCAPCPVSQDLDQAQILQIIWDQNHEHE